MLVRLNKGEKLTTEEMISSGLTGPRPAAVIEVLRKKGHPVLGRGRPADPYRMSHARTPAEDMPLFAAPSDGWVYFIEAVGLGRVKIGHSSDPERRMASLATGSAVPLRLLARMQGGRDLEAALHERFAGLRVAGVREEWFTLGGDLREFIGRLSQA